MSAKRFACALAFTVVLASEVLAASCVWKVSGPNDGVLYLGGSIHALQSADYPLPPAFNRAFDASTRLAFEAESKVVRGGAETFLKAGQYSRGDSLKNHVDPRTFDYLRRFFALLKVPEDRFARFRPWYLAMMLQAPHLHGLSTELGVEGFLERRAHANKKATTGLESLREGVQIFSGLSDRESEAFLLLTFIPNEPGSPDRARMMEAWRRGDAEFLSRSFHQSFQDFPSLAQRILGTRNRNWVPKIEKFIRSGHTYFVIVGAAHMGGPDGVLALLKARGYRIEQL